MTESVLSTPAVWPASVRVLAGGWEPSTLSLGPLAGGQRGLFYLLCFPVHGSENPTPPHPRGRYAATSRRAAAVSLEA